VGVTLTIVSVAYPLAPVRPDTVGGAEQVLGRIEAALVRAGHRSIMIACAGSTPAGTLVGVPAVDEPLDDDRITQARERHRRAICDVLDACRVDLVHMHGVDFHAYLPPPGVPVLVTLHLPVACYPAAALRPSRPDTWLHCVSATQHATCPPGEHLLPPIENGVAVDEFSHPYRRRKFALMLSRICPEKGVHVAIDAAKSAGIPLLIGGQVFPYPEHDRYFAEEVLPRLDRWRRFIGPVGPRRKQRLLAAARCLIVASSVAETSSLVAREALAAGTPVVALARGALAETIDHGKTGFLVEHASDLADAISRAEAIDPAACRQSARERFPLARMIDQYLSLYARLSSRQQSRANAA
jgi:glycosyltransferase involved in cell wall biosynthesis